MNAVRQKCRPKHQVLILKCYPKYQKNVQEVKPNSSELSYLLYYASTRRTKLQKVGAFLEKRTATDVWRQRLGNVQVTLQILTALIEKSPKDLPLYGESVLKILDTILRSQDINMIEETIPTWEAYCKHQDTSTLIADQGLSQQYQEMVKAYASFGIESYWHSKKNTPSRPIQIRWRKASLQAIKAVVDSECLGADGSKQLDIIMPVILENLYSDGEDIISNLQQKAQASEKTDLVQARKRRMSVATVTTVDTVEADPASASGTAADADKVAEEEVRILAVRALKQIFTAGVSTNKGQVRFATALTLRFIANRNPPRMKLADSSPRIKRGNWATSLIETVTRWTPVAERFVIVVTAMETLTRSPIVESKLEMQLTLATMIDWILSSSINLIGLSVMDVLLGFVQHILLLLQLGGRNSKIAPHPQQKDGLDLFHDAKETFDGPLEEPRGRTEPDATTPSPIRQELLLRLQKGMSDLATHIYYTDQISDMIQALLARLKPSSNLDVASTAAAIEHPEAAANAIASSVSLQEDPTTDGFFSFATARVTALKAVKDILLVANQRKSITGTAAEARSRVNIQVWEATQWLLRDEDREVRLSYTDALLTWLQFETNKNDLLIAKGGLQRKKTGPKKPHGENGDVKLSQRAISNASQRDKAKKPPRSTFLQLLHLAIYDNAIDTPENDDEVALQHLLLTQLIERLGVNASRNGIPMILRLQQDITSDNIISSAKAKVNIASLTHGYLWALSEKFDFETSYLGNEVHKEIARRKQNSVWMEKIRLPPIPLDQIRATLSTTEKPPLEPQVTRTSFHFFSKRAELVSEVTRSYNNSLVSPVSSPPGSPSRVFSVPSLQFGYGYSSAASPSNIASEDQLPEKVQEEMKSTWSKEACIAAVERESIKAASLSGSKGGTGSGTKNNHLTVNGNTKADGSPPRLNPSPIPKRTHQHEQGNHINRASYGLMGGLGSLSKFRRASTQEGSPTPITPTSSHESTVRVNELKRIFSAARSAPRHSSPLGFGGAGSDEQGAGQSKGFSMSDSDNASDSESLLSYSDNGQGIPPTAHGNAQNGTTAIKSEDNSVTKEDNQSISTTSSRSLPEIPENQNQTSALRALEGDSVPQSSANPTPRNPLTNREASTSQVDLTLSTLNSPSTPTSPSQSDRPLSSPSRQSKRDGAYYVTTSPRLNGRDGGDDEIPPVPKIPSSLNLPGGFPMDIPSKSSSKSPSPERKTKKSSPVKPPTTGPLSNKPTLEPPKEGSRKRIPSPTGTATILPRQTSLTFKLNRGGDSRRETEKLRPSTAPERPTNGNVAESVRPSSAVPPVPPVKIDGVDTSSARGRKSARGNARNSGPKTWSKALSGASTKGRNSSQKMDLESFLAGLKVDSSDSGKDHGLLNLGSGMEKQAYVVKPPY
ncbi:MAG: hypothetical protein Q9160_005565 [Pyrenula sp. 1 TL-2023]